MVPTIMLTCGTTDTFAIDDISSVRLTTERLCRKYHIPVLLTFMSMQRWDGVYSSFLIMILALTRWRLILPR